MNSFLQRIFLFVLSLFVSWGLLWVVSLNNSFVETQFIAERSSNGEVNLKTAELMEMSPSDTLDFLFVGSSTCYRGIDPHALIPHGLKGFSVCSSSQSLGNSDFVLDVALSFVSTRYLVVDVYPALWNREEAVNKESARDWLVNSSTPIKGAIFEMVWATKVPYYILLSWYFQISNYIGIEFKPVSSNLTDVYKGLGFVSSEVESIESIECEELKVEMSTEVCEIINRMINKVGDKGGQTILLNPPQLCEETFILPQCFEGGIYIDGNQWPGAKIITNYYDDHHLVDVGAESYSIWLSNELRILSTDPSSYRKNRILPGS
ncbi:MAG: hypothetical protein COA49_05600 [Bacteroidetes bacterium]|nr:MAG: hypothetical protein COA49_05600 [Bacteroidota bacterium]